MLSTAGARDPRLHANSLNTTTSQSPTASTSLLDPVPGHPDVDVMGQLQLFAEMPGMHDAVTAILLLEEGKHIPSTINEASCQKAAGVLLELGQGRWLCRLAEELPLNYRLNIGSPHQKTFLLNCEQRAQVLALVSASWPQGATVSLTLCTSLSSKAIQSLHPFLQRPSTLNVSVVLDDATDAALATEFAAALQLRTIAALTIECGVSTPEPLGCAACLIRCSLSSTP